VEHWLPGGGGASAINLNDALQTVNSDRDFLADLAAQFTRDYPATRENLRAALDRQDLHRVEWIAHSLKSVVGIFGANTAAALLQKLEDAAENRGLNEAEELMPKVLMELARVEGCLAAFSAEAATPPVEPDR
jgi:HPt (histidine-containing phosphotransfer) domain-containing protein